MKMAINNMKDLRNHALGTLQKLDDKEIDIKDAIASAKIYQSIISTIKTEIDYNKMREKAPRIDFLEMGNVVEHDITPALENKKK